MPEDILAYLISRLILDCALPAAQWLAKSWVKIYTLLVPASQRRDRRDQILSDLHEHEVIHREHGDHLALLALQTVHRTISGCIDDVAWAAPYWRQTLPHKLDTWSKRIRGEHGNENAIAALAIFGFFNFAAFTSDSPDKLTEILLANCVCVIGLVATRFSPWVERAFLIFLYVLMLGAIAVLAWLITEYPLYEVPYIRDYLQHLAIFVPPITLAFVINTRFCRTHIFRERRWPVFTGWALIAAFIVGALLALGVSFAAIGKAVAVIGIAVVMLVVLLALFVIAAMFLWMALTTASSFGMRRLAAAIRRID